MYCVVEYNDYRKEQSFNLHGYFEDKNNAISYAKNQINKIIQDFGGFIKESNNHDTSYLHLENDKICEFRTFDVEDLPDDELMRYINNSIEDKQNLCSFISDCISIRKYGFPEEYENIKNKMISEFTKEEIKDILNNLAINYGPTDFGPEIYMNTSQVFAVVELKKIDNK